MKKKKSKKIIAIIITLIVVAILIIGGYFIFVKKVGNVRNKLITAENYNQITEQVTEELTDSDDAYYFIYACITYMSEAGLTEEYLYNQNDNILFKEIYNKTVNQLIEEGKTMMEENDVTLEQFKQQVEAINNNSSFENIDENEVNELINGLEDYNMTNNEI